MNTISLISKNGFLPHEDPLVQLPEEYFAWEKIAASLPKLLVYNQLRHAIEKMPLLSTVNLNNQHELERAMLVLSFFGHAYVWGSKKPALNIPESLAKPWYEVALQLGRPPVLSYASYALHNWRRYNKKAAIKLGNISLLQNFLGGIDEEWFVLIHVDIEKKAAAALSVLDSLQQAAAQNQNKLLLSHLDTVINALLAMLKTLKRMPEHCDPYIYYNRVRPYIHGWKDNAALPSGLIYEGVAEYRQQPQKFRGETGAQSSIIPSLDAVLGIEHEPDMLRIYLMEMREYMPPNHRKFISQLEKNQGIRRYIIEHQKKEPVLREKYNECIHLLAEFRKTHVGYAAQYIQKQSQTSLANPTEIGTGGTPFMTYLQKHKNETLKFLI